MGFISAAGTFTSKTDNWIKWLQTPVFRRNGCLQFTLSALTVCRENWGFLNAQKPKCEKIRPSRIKFCPISKPKHENASLPQFKDPIKNTTGLGMTWSQLLALALLAGRLHTGTVSPLWKIYFGQSSKWTSSLQTLLFHPWLGPPALNFAFFPGRSGSYSAEISSGP